MTRKHLYFNSSNLDYIRYLNDDERFEPVFHYHLDEVKKISQYEFGRIKTKANYYHFVMGHPPIKGCPWCGMEPVLKKLDRTPSCPMGISSYNRYCLICLNCGSSGPVINVNPIIELDKNMMEVMEDRIRQRYKEIKTWDSELNKESDVT